MVAACERTERKAQLLSHTSCFWRDLALGMDGCDGCPFRKLVRRSNGLRRIVSCRQIGAAAKFRLLMLP